MVLSERLRELISNYRETLRSCEFNPVGARLAPSAWSIAWTQIQQARQDFAGPVLWYCRNIASLVAPPRGQPSAEGYEDYPGIREAARAGSGMNCWPVVL